MTSVIGTDHLKAIPRAGSRSPKRTHALDTFVVAMVGRHDSGYAEGMSFRYETEAELWLWSGGSWHFLTLPPEVSAGLKTLRGSPKGFGSMRIEATIGKTSWRTSVFPTKAGDFLLPVKADVRKREGIAAGDTVKVSVEVLI